MLKLKINKYHNMGAYNLSIFAHTALWSVSLVPFRVKPGTRACRISSGGPLIKNESNTSFCAETGNWASQIDATSANKINQTECSISQKGSQTSWHIDKIAYHVNTTHCSSFSKLTSQQLDTKTSSLATKLTCLISTGHWIW